MVPPQTYLRCAGCSTLTRIDLLADKRPGDLTHPLCPNCYGPGWMPFLPTWAAMPFPAHQK